MLDGFKALKPLPVVKKQMLTVKRTMHLQMRNKGTRRYVDLTNDHVKETLSREQNVQRHAFFL
jgi:uncharacterized protein YabE (DUF348 family)